MRPVRYNVAMSLDGFIADAHGGFDWIIDEPAIDFAALFGNVDTVVMGRRTWEVVLATGGPSAWRSDARVFVASRTLAAAGHSGVTIVADGLPARVAALRAERGDGEIWCFGGGMLAGQLLDAGLIDRVEVALIPVLLGRGHPLLGGGPRRAALRLDRHTAYPSGLVLLEYAVAT